MQSPSVFAEEEPLPVRATAPAISCCDETGWMAVHGWRFCWLLAARLRRHLRRGKKREVQPRTAGLCRCIIRQDYARPCRFTWHGSEKSPVAAIRVRRDVRFAWSSVILSRIVKNLSRTKSMRLAGKMGLYRGDGLGRDALRLLLAEYGVDGALARAGCAGNREYAAQRASRSSYTWGAGYFTGSGHYVVLRGIAENGELLVADPNSKENTRGKDVSLCGDYSGRRKAIIRS